MADNEAYSLVGIKYQSTGAEKAAADGKSVAAGLDGVAVASDKATRATASVGRSFEGLQKRYDSTYRALTEQKRALEDLSKARAQGLVDDNRQAQLTNLINQRYNEASKGVAGFATQTGLARHEMINLSRQAQDVVVSLQGGQGFGTVMLQQGSQILDVLGSSQGGIRGSLSALGTSFRSLFTIGRVAFAGIAGAVAGAAFATADYLAQQKDVERSLIGAGRRSASPADINRIAGERSSLTGLSMSETREAALEFAKTGQIHSRVIGEMIETTKNFALVTGQSSKDAATALAGAFTNIEGIDNLNRQFAFLDGNTRRFVEQLLLAGRTTEAAAMANDRLKVVLKEVEETQGGLARGWTAVGNAISDASSKVGEYIAKAAGLQKSSKSDRATELQSEISRLEGMGGDTGGFTGRLFSGQLEKYRSELSGIKTELAQIESKGAFNKLTSGAQAAVAAADPLRAKLDQVVGTLTRLKDAQAQGINIPGLEMAVTYYEQIAQQVQNQMQAQDSLASKYPQMTSEFAKQVESLKDQNALLRARENGTEATVAAAIAYKNAIAAGATETEAAAIKSETLKNNLLQASTAASSIQIDLDWSDFESYVQASGRPNTIAGGDTGSYTPSSEFAPRTMQQSGEFYAPSLAEDPLGYYNTDAAFRPLPSSQGQYNVRQMAEEERRRQEALLSAEVQYLGGSSNKEDKIKGLEMQIASLQRGLFENPENIWQIKALQRSIEELRNEVEENTEALNNVTLNPLYNGRDALRVGYMGAAKGMDMMVQGGIPGVDSVPIHIMAQQGERVQVTPAGQVGNDNSKSTVVNVTQNFGGSGSSQRRSMRQLGQKYGQLMASLS